VAAARAEHEATGDKVRRLHDARYAADSWPHQRRVLIKAEVTDRGDNPRFVVTNLRGAASGLYELYAARGEMENRIKELKCDLRMDRTSCHRFAANQFRLLLHAAAYLLLCAVRDGLAGTDLARAQVGTLQRRLCGRNDRRSWACGSRRRPAASGCSSPPATRCRAYGPDC